LVITKCWRPKAASVGVALRLPLPAMASESIWQNKGGFSNWQENGEWSALKLESTGRQSDQTTASNCKRAFYTYLKKYISQGVSMSNLAKTSILRALSVFFASFFLFFASAQAQTNSEKQALDWGQQLVASFYKADVSKFWDSLNKENKDIYGDLAGFQGFNKKQLDVWGKETKLVLEEAKNDSDGVLYSRTMVVEKNPNQQWQILLHFNDKGIIDLVVFKLIVISAPPSDG
jgi:hypothetical protein